MFIKIIKKLFSNFYNLYLAGLTILISLPVLAPILLKLGLIQIANLIYFVYSFFCHQFAYRSIHLYDYQVAWCARDTGIWFGIWIIALLIKLGKIKGIKWYWVIPFVVPIALDGGLQTIFTILNVSAAGDLVGLPLYISTNLVRFITGSIFGIGLSLWLSPMVMSDSNAGRFEANPVVSNPSGKSSRFLNSNLLKIVAVCFLMFPLYLVFFSLWDSTSTTNKPLYPLDAVVKAPQNDFLNRRENAVCPTSGFQDLFAFDCFIQR